MVGRSLVPVADKLLSGRNNNIRVNNGRARVESKPRRNYRKDKRQSGLQSGRP